MSDRPAALFFFSAANPLRCGDGSDLDRPDMPLRRKLYIACGDIFASRQKPPRSFRSFSSPRAICFAGLTRDSDCPESPELSGLSGASSALSRERRLYACRGIVSVCLQAVSPIRRRVRSEHSALGIDRRAYSILALALVSSESQRPSLICFDFSNDAVIREHDAGEKTVILTKEMLRHPDTDASICQEML